jgi:hypothetical protein
MPKTISHFASTFSDLLTGNSSKVEVAGRQEEIRTVMLESLSDIDSSQPDVFSKTLATIAQSKDIQSLWYARSELLRLIADRKGEQTARRVLDEITEMFRGLVPDSQMPPPKRKMRS